MRKSSKLAGWLLVAVGLVGCHAVIGWEEWSVTDDTVVTDPDAGDAGGAGGQGGAAGTGGQTNGGYVGVLHQSCSASDTMACGEDQPVSCCAVVEINGGSFMMGRTTLEPSGSDAGSNSDYYPNGRGDELPEHSVALSRFYIDKFEVTVGRFRRFIDSYNGIPPKVGSGKVHGQTSGWRHDWSNDLPGGSDGLKKSLRCSTGLETWSDAAEGKDGEPINCVNWIQAYAFCIWDGGRLPTEAEWEFVSSGEGEDRLYPWGWDQSDAWKKANLTTTSHGGSPHDHLVGSYSTGQSKSGVFDMGGSVAEWCLDSIASYTTGCTADCVADDNSNRVVRGGSYQSYLPDVRATARASSVQTARLPTTGFRCVYEK